MRPLPRPISAADFKTRVFLHFLQELHHAARPLDSFRVHSSLVAGVLDETDVRAVVYVEALHSGLVRTYRCAKGQSWTFQFRNDLRAGKFDPEVLPHPQMGIRRQSNPKNGNDPRR